MKMHYVPISGGFAICGFMVQWPVVLRHTHDASEVTCKGCLGKLAEEVEESLSFRHGIVDITGPGMSAVVVGDIVLALDGNEYRVIGHHGGNAVLVEWVDD